MCSEVVIEMKNEKHINREVNVDKCEATNNNNRAFYNSKSIYL